MHRRFLNFLMTRGRVTPQEAERIDLSKRQFREVGGAIALAHDLITLDQLDEILDQLTADLRFGEVAIRLGHLTPDQVERLLVIQEMQEVMEICEMLLLRGALNRDELLREIAVFFNTASVRSSANA